MSSLMQLDAPGPRPRICPSPGTERSSRIRATYVLERVLGQHSRLLEGLVSWQFGNEYERTINGAICGTSLPRFSTQRTTWLDDYKASFPSLHLYTFDTLAIPVMPTE